MQMTPRELARDLLSQTQLREPAHETSGLEPAITTAIAMAAQNGPGAQVVICSNEIAVNKAQKEFARAKGVKLKYLLSRNVKELLDLFTQIL